MLYVLYSMALLGLSALPVLMVIRNLPRFHRTPSAPAAPHACVSVLMPARNEEAGIGDALASILASQQVEIEVIVMDDHSTDRTAEIVEELRSRHPQLRLAHAPELPVGWNGKQHACWQLAQLAQHPRLLFIDADVRLQPHAIARLVAEMETSQVELLSGFPQQQTRTWLEKLLIPMMYVVLLGYLPLDQMRATTNPQFGAGCGQLFLADKAAYLAMGGHSRIHASRHDGLKLPRAFRQAGYRSDLVDASDLASVRMYSSGRQVVRGLMKNADEGIANTRLIFLFSLLLLGAATLPLLSLPHAVYHGWPVITWILLAVATLLSFVPRAMIAQRLEQSSLGVFLHPLAVAIFVGIQWVVYVRSLLRLPAISWRGRQ